MEDKEHGMYFHIDPKVITAQNCGGREFLREQINAHISTINCLREIINSCVENYEIENLKPCLMKFRSSVAELNVSSLNGIIDDLISDADNEEPKEMLSTRMKDFLLICELVLIDLSALKKNEGIAD